MLKRSTLILVTLVIGVIACGLAAEPTPEPTPTMAVLTVAEMLAVMEDCAPLIVQVSTNRKNG